MPKPTPQQFRRRIQELEVYIEATNKENVRLREDRDRYRRLVNTIAKQAIECTKDQSHINNAWLITRALSVVADSKEPFVW